MRDIKFRVWDGEVMGEVAYMKFPLIEELPCMQFTGLKDKNGKEIYEGDVVKTFNGDIAEMRYGEFQDEDAVDRDANFYIDADGDERKGVGFYAKNKNGYHNSLDNMAYKWIEVIGNIYENPELIESL